MNKNTSNWREMLPIYGPAVALALVAFIVAIQYVKPAPPDVVVMATGQPGGAYHRFAGIYRKHLAKEGIRLELVNTAGSLENLELLEEGRVDLAFVQGGTRSAQLQSGIEALASLYYEPLWLFHRSDLNLDRVGNANSMRIAVGAEGSGTQALVMRLFRENKLQEKNVTPLYLTDQQAANQLKEGSIDAAFFVASPNSQTVSGLLHTPDVQLASFERAAAYTRRHQYLTELILPEGAENLQLNVPPRDIHLLAATAALVANEDIHPAIVGLMMQTLETVHGEGGWFEEAGQFPNRNNLEFPLSLQAASYFKQGPPLLQRYLPFWAASFIDRVKLMILPLIVMLIPMLKLMPPLYRWRMRARIYRWYEQLEAVDFDLLENGSLNRAALLADLDRIEMEVRQIKVPLSYADQLYHLREHIDLVREKLAEA